MNTTDRAITTRFAGTADAEAAGRLLREMDRHYRPGEPLPDESEYAEMVRRTLEQAEGTRFALSLTSSGTPVGIGCVAVIRPGRDLKGLLYLKDLYVAEEWRGRAIGTDIMRFLARFASENRIGRIDFTTDSDNLQAQRLYDRLGGRVVEKVHFTIPADVMERLAADETRSAE